MPMPIDETELRSRLEETAARARVPRFTADDLAARVRRIRRRRRNRALVLSAVLVPAVAAAVVVPLLPRGVGNPPVISSPGASPPGPSFRVTVTGHTQVFSDQESPYPAVYYVTPGEKLTMIVDVIVPDHPAMAPKVWLGITNGILSAGISGSAEMNPVLAASTRVPLRPGTHRFVLHWTVPARLVASASRQLSVEWMEPAPLSGGAERFLAEFEAPPGPAFPTATVSRLRSAVLREARGCDVPRPASIMAVRTTLAKATVDMGGGPVPSNADQVVYLVVMKGDFNELHAKTPPCAGAPSGRYFSTTIDASTLMTMAQRLASQPPPLPLQDLGPVANLTP